MAATTASMSAVLERSSLPPHHRFSNKSSRDCLVSAPERFPLPPHHRFSNKSSRACLVSAPERSPLPPHHRFSNKSSRSCLVEVTCDSPSLKPSRRVCLTSVLLCGVAAPLSAAFAYTRPQVPPMMEGRDIPGFERMENGVLIQDVTEGSGATAGENDSVEFNYVCRRANGYFVYSTVDQFTGENTPVTLPLSGGKMIAGLKSILVGMKPGGKRRAIVPPKVGYVSEDLEPLPTEFGPQRSLLSHAKEPLLFEVQLLRIK